MQNPERILIDSDNNIETGYLAPGIGADGLVEIYGLNQAIFSSVLYTFNDNRDNTDWNGFTALGPANSARDGRFVETQIPLFDLGINQDSDVIAIWQTSDEFGNTDMLDFALDSNLQKIDIERSFLITTAKEKDDLFHSEDEKDKD